MNAEEIRVGGYQILTLLLLSVNFIVVAMSHALTIFYKYTPKFYCEDDWTGATTSTVSTTPMMAKHETRNRTYGCGCSGRYVFETGHGYESPAMEWQLVCEKESLLRAGTEAYFAALLLGGCVGGILADRIGRLPVLAICLYAQGTMAVALNVVQDYNLFLVFRALQGFFIQGLESCTFILCMELFPVKFRTLVMLIILSMRSLGLALLSALSYGVSDWRILQLVISVPTAATVLYIWIIPESPRWLIAKEKLMEAEMAIEKIGYYNRLCGSSERDENLKNVQRIEIDKRPEKPKRKTLPSPMNENSATEFEKSLEESKNLLDPSSAESELSRPHSSTEEKNQDRIKNLHSEEKSNSHSELDIEEITSGSFTLVTDENDILNDRKDDTGPSYLLVSKEALSVNDINDGEEKQSLLSTFLRFLRSKFIGLTCIIMMFLWFTTAMSFHGLVSLPQRLSNERHVSLALAAGAEVVSFVLTFLVVSRCGRRGPLCVSQLLVGGACVMISILSLVRPQHETTDWSVYVKTTIITFGRVANISSFFVLRLLAIELFPTISRGAGVGLCISAEMIGGLITPYILILNNYVPEVARILLGLVCICSSFLCITFPETLCEVLPDSVEAVKNLGQNKKNENETMEHSKNSLILREKLFSEDWVDAGNGIIVNFTDKTNS